MLKNRKCLQEIDTESDTEVLHGPVDQRRLLCVILRDCVTQDMYHMEKSALFFSSLDRGCLKCIALKFVINWQLIKVSQPCKQTNQHTISNWFEDQMGNGSLLYHVAPLKPLLLNCVDKCIFAAFQHVAQWAAFTRTQYDLTWPYKNTSAILNLTRTSTVIMAVNCCPCVNCTMWI